MGLSEKVSQTALSAAKWIAPKLEPFSELSAKHASRMAEAAAYGKFLESEIESRSKIKQELLQNFYTTTDPAERTRIERDLDHLDGRLRSLAIYRLSLAFAPEQKNVQRAEKTERLGKLNIAPHWWDKFNELARVRNEDWRENLLARALAVESQNPGSVSPRALWFLGTVEELIHRAFALTLSLCSEIGGRLMIPFATHYTHSLIPGISSYPNKLAHLLFLLDPLGVLGSTNAYRTFPANSQFYANCQGVGVRISTKEEDLNIHGLIPTLLGDSIAQFYPRDSNELGRKIFDEWIESLTVGGYQVDKLVSL